MALLEPVQITDVREKAREIAVANLMKQQQGQQQARDALLKRKEQQEVRLTALENALLGSLIQPGRYAAHRDKIMTELQEIDQSLAETTLMPRPEYDELFAILDSIIWDELDDEGWRELLEPMVDRVVITDCDVAVEWLPICDSLLAISHIL